jgi:4-hydroxy-2-oxoheptanedioate aldolase
MIDPGRLKRKVEANEVCLLSGNFESADMIDFVGSLGIFDGVWIDMEHSPVMWSELAHMSRAADMWGMTSIVRVRRNDPSIIALTLGEGIGGVIVPHVDTKEQAERVVDAAKFDPVGHRGAAGGRKSYGTADYYGEANDATFVAVMIEDIAGVQNLAEILTVPHIDLFFVAKHDLSQSMGMLRDQANPKIQETFDGALRQIVAAGRVAGTAVTEKNLDKYLAMGVTCIKVPQWRDWIRDGAQAYAAAVRAKTEGLDA